MSRGFPCRSVGIIIIDDTTPEKKVLLVQTRNTYQTGCLIAGKQWYTDADLSEEFVNRMSMWEKNKFLKNDDFFKVAFEHCYEQKLASMHETKRQRVTLEHYLEYKKSMETLLPMMIDNKVDGPRPWNFPKGRMGQESSVSSQISKALSELQEETMITPDMIEVFPKIKPYVIKYTDYNVQYIKVLYFARKLPKLQFGIDRSDVHQIDEVSDIKWFSKEELNNLVVDPITKEHVVDNFDKIIEWYEYSKSEQYSKPRIRPRPCMSWRSVSSKSTSSKSSSSASDSDRSPSSSSSNSSSKSHASDSCMNWRQRSE
jgi:8-oxo-dGTP pyrophosphatase MutT (NUDIX family)